jgi:hypothetical protein
MKKRKGMIARSLARKYIYLEVNGDGYHLSTQS